MSAIPPVSQSRPCQRFLPCLRVGHVSDSSRVSVSAMSAIPPVSQCRPCQRFLSSLFVVRLAHFSILKNLVDFTFVIVFFTLCTVIEFLFNSPVCVSINTVEILKAALSYQIKIILRLIISPRRAEGYFLIQFRLEWRIDNVLQI